MKLARFTLIINGVERFVLCDPEKDSLAVALRRYGLTGVKIGCGTGVCGACTVLLNGAPVRACTRRMKNVKEHSTVLTIEGIGAPGRLHPLQQAFITHGGTQCGFCAPGFIVSAHALLAENPAPTREAVRAWFKKHRNICRCTGYKPIVDSVMEAAAVLRGEKTMRDITYDFEGEKEIYGSKHPRPTSLAKVCGLADYGDDIKLKMPEGTAHLAVVISEVPHARILRIDTEEAEGMPGVIKVMTAKDVKGSNNADAPAVVPRQKGKGVTVFPILADKVINKRGDVVALVAADTEEHAREAAKRVKQDLEPLPAYKSLLESVMPNAIQLHETLPNFFMEQPVFKGKDTAELFEDAPFVAEGSFHSQHEPHLPIEPDTVQGYIGADGLLTLQCKSQSIGENLETVSESCGIPADRLRIIMNPTGGSFGYSTTANILGLVTTAVQNLDMPVTLTLRYDEFNHITGKRSATFTNGRIACDAEGKIIAAEYDLGLDHGAYANLAGKIFNNLVSVGFHGYNVPNFKALARGASSNNAFCTAYRGFGAPQAYTTTEALIDMIAEKAGMDPWEFRHKNAARPGDLTINSRPYHDYLYPSMLEKIKPHYDRYKAEAEAARAEGRHVGVGLGMGGFIITIGMFDSAEVALELNPDGSFTHYNTWEDVGQGGDIGALVHAVKALAPLGVKADRVRLVMNDSKTCPDTGLAAASRSHYMGGNATIDAAEKLMNAMKKPDGSYRTYDEMAAEGIPTKYVGHYDQANIGLPPGLDPNTGEGEKNPTYMYGVNLAQVEVDVNTGKTTVLKFACVADVGVIGSRQAVEGQAYGGISHSIGFALSEDYDGLDKQGNMVGCGIPEITDIPDEIDLIFVETPRPAGPHGSCGCSEDFQSSNHMAVVNAIHNACGVRVYALPATPDKVKEGWERKQRGEDLTPPKYFLGSDFEDELEMIRANPI
ncbi:MAG: molybdopterin-dependent oxidoreductase [Clostridiales Family XIII bacterium]|jgi:aldehyde oxidoreductase|nr:molybdopterin-dependent oxidoreductase [Clostridiales Family XIII bacterium]